MAELDKSIFLKQFREEAGEHLQILNQGLLQLEQDPSNRQVLDQVFRSAHTIKGTSSMLGFQSIKELAHALEDLLQKARDRELILTPEHMDLLFETLDYLRMQIDEASEGKEPVGSDELVAKLRTIEEKSSQAEAPSEKEPPKKVEPASFVQTKQAAPVPAKYGDSIRVEVNKLDTLLNLTGELTIQRSRLYEIMRELRKLKPYLERMDQLLRNLRESVEKNQVAGEIKETFSMLRGRVNESIEKLFEAQGRVDQYASQIQEGVMQIRMLPLSTIFATFPRVVRDAARQTGKKVNLNMHGSDTELDKRVIDQIVDPLMHLLRNAVDHGVEPPEERQKKNKPVEGKIDITAYARGNQVVIEVEDDGRGIDREKVRQKAIRRGLTSEEDALSMDQDEQIFSFLFTPGFSTKDKVSALSGRGVGLDVVKAKVEELKGSIELSSEVDKGSKFTIRLPLTLSLTEVIMVMEEGCSFAIPLANIKEMVLVSTDDIRKIGDREAIPLRDELIPLAKLGWLLNLPPTHPPPAAFPVIVIEQGEKKLGLSVDELRGKQEIVIKAFGSFYPKVEHLVGATILGSGEIVPILDVLQLMQRARRTDLKALATQMLPKELEKKRVLIVEDSLMAREAEKSILEAAGYEVDTSVDGEDALRFLQEKEVDLVVADIEMPRMDGFTLLQHIRSSEKWKDLPVVIVTTRDSNEDKQKGIELGADRYIVKGAFDQGELLDTVKALIGEA